MLLLLCFLRLHACACLTCGEQCCGMHVRLNTLSSSSTYKQLCQCTVDPPAPICTQLSFHGGQGAYASVVLLYPCEGFHQPAVEQLKRAQMMTCSAVFTTIRAYIDCEQDCSGRRTQIKVKHQDVY